jgi:hypothetical protein
VGFPAPISSGRCVHACGKYLFKGLFFENNRFNQDKNLQNSSVLRQSGLPAVPKPVF